MAGKATSMGDCDWDIIEKCTSWTAYNQDTAFLGPITIVLIYMLATNFINHKLIFYEAYGQL